MTIATRISATHDPELVRRANIETTWATREVYADALNADRLAKWETRRAFLLESDLPPCKPKQPDIIESELADIPRIRAGRRR